ncbi:MAG: type IV pilus secretin PilQ [Deltaproteobacteria bacterium]|nr:type IV pilus secretin PilQ [Deltaproteobacteria bacterium]
MATGFLSKTGERLVLCFGLAALLGPLAVAVPFCDAANVEAVAGQGETVKETAAAPSRIPLRTIGRVDIDLGRTVISTDGPVAKLRYFALENPQRLVVDIYDAQPSFADRQFLLNDGFSILRVGGDSGKTRFVFDAGESNLPSYSVAKTGQGVLVSWSSAPGTAPAGTAPAGTAPAETAPAYRPSPVSAMGAPVSIEAMDFMVREGKSLFTVTLSRPAELVPLDRMGKIVRFGVKNAHLAQRFRRSFDSSSFPSAVRIITPYTVVRGSSEEVRFAAEMKEVVPMDLTLSGNTLVFSVDNGSYGDRNGAPEDIEIKAVPLPASKEQPAPARRAIEMAEGGYGRESGDGATSLAAALESGKSRGRYTGTRVSLVFDDADIRKIFQLLGEVSNLNLVLGEEVKGSISLRLIDVPWDQAFDLVLEMKELGKLQDGNIVRILPRRKISEMDEARLMATRTKEKLENLITVAIPVSYAPLESLEKPVKDRLSDRGRYNLDKGNKQLIIIDVPSSVDAIRELIRMIDTPVRQVMIEARIVEVRSTFSRDLGLKWNISNLSNSTGSSVGLGGSLLIPPASVFNSSVYGMGSLFTYSGLDNTIIDMRLAAAETSGNARIISKPRVVTLNGEEATIAQGTSIAYQTISDEGTKTEFVDANLELKVTPTINPDNSVIMKIEATNNQPSTQAPDLATAPSIDKKEAKTTVLVNDGETTVIGGIFVDAESFSTSGVPVLMNIPLLGHLFKSTNKSYERNELLVFITPKILE